ncbi:MAG: hypothetical protein U1A77_04150 [Pirellulales bacterium]
MSTSTDSPPFFHALAVFFCKRNRLYRIYICPDELVFVWAGKGAEGLAGMRYIGGPLGRAIAAKVDPSTENSQRLRVLDRTLPSDLTANDPRNMRIAIEGFTNVRIAKRSNRHARVFSDHGHQALLFLRHRSLGKYRLGIATVEDVHMAINELPRVFGSLCDVEIDLPASEQDCGCVFCRRRESA